MAFSAIAHASSKSDMNIVPLIDVLLVLLIIFMVTSPLLSFEIPVDLPQIDDQSVKKDQPTPIDLRIDASGALFWDNLPLQRSALETSLQIETLGKEIKDQPLLRIDASPEAEYQVIADVLAVARNVGVAKIGFVGAL
ncbi:MAG: ExbD/TolR family protein [Pseudomarimonas sp.]